MMEGKPICGRCLKTHFVDQECKADPAVVPVEAAGEAADEFLEQGTKYDRAAAMRERWAKRKAGG